MCFSATASFVAAGILCVVGITALRTSKSKSYYLLACVPLLFSVQQLFEGIVWLTHTSPQHHFVCYSSIFVFLIFAFLIWPIWIPMALFFSEKIKVRRKLLGYFILLGVLLSVFNAYKLAGYRDSMAIISAHIEYGAGYTTNIPLILYVFIYACATIFPCFIASIKWSKILGVYLLISLIFTYVFMIEALTSVWCFFAAILSCIILLAVRETKLTP